MCSPTALMIASTVVSVGGQMYQASAQAAAMEHQANINQANAVLADNRAKDAIERGQLEEERKKREATLLRKEQENSFAAANLDTGYGSPLDIITSSAMEAQLDASLIRTNAEREAEDFENQAINFRNQASMDRASAKGARIGGLFASVGTAVDGGVGLYRYQTTGRF